MKLSEASSVSVGLVITLIVGGTWAGVSWAKIETVEARVERASQREQRIFDLLVDIRDRLARLEERKK